MNIHKDVITEYEDVKLDILVKFIKSEWSFQWNKGAAAPRDVH